MATFGVGEAITAISILIDVAVTISSANGKIQKIQKEIRRVKTRLESIQIRLKNPSSPLGQADPDMYANPRRLAHEMLTLEGKQ
jgi:hypothetical protein